MQQVQQVTAPTIHIRIYFVHNTKNANCNKIY